MSAEETASMDCLKPQCSRGDAAEARSAVSSIVAVMAGGVLYRTENSFIQYLLCNLECNDVHSYNEKSSLRNVYRSLNEYF
jgi:hypothetical protein